MKILLLNLLLSIGNPTAETEQTDDFQWLLDELNQENIEMAMEVEGQSLVKVFDSEGNLVEEFNKEKLEGGELTNSEYKTVLNSEFMFEYLGDSYYLLDK